MSIFNNNNKVFINGKEINIPGGNNVSIIKNRVFIDGKEVDTSNTVLNNMNAIVNVIIEGNVDKVKCSGYVEVKGNVFTKIDCGGRVEITGEVKGDIDCGGRVEIHGSHIGEIDAGGSVTIK